MMVYLLNQKAEYLGLIWNNTMDKELKRFIIHVSTNWCGMDNDYPAMAKNESDLWDLAEELAYDNFQSYDLWSDIAAEYGYDTEEMTDEDWDELQSKVDEAEYYNSYIEEFDGDEEDWDCLVEDAERIYGTNV